MAKEKEAEEAATAPRRSSRQREKRKIADEAELAAEEAAPKVAKKQAGAKKQPKKENRKNVAAEKQPEAAKESKNEEDSKFGPETQELPGSQESQSSASEGLPVPDLPISDLYPKSSQEQTDTDSDGMNFNNEHSRTKLVSATCLQKNRLTDRFFYSRA